MKTWLAAVMGKVFLKEISESDFGRWLSLHPDAILASIAIILGIASWVIPISIVRSRKKRGEPS
jgi:hypothetical protein